MAQLNEGTIRLMDGRIVGYTDWGPRDAPVLVYCHGQPGSRREIEFATGLVESSPLDLRVLALDRPGYGSSTFQRDRTFLDWPTDVAAVADALGIERFAVLGASGGSPYAFSCGHVLGDRVERIGVVVGCGPPHATGMQQSALFRLPSRNYLVRRAQMALLAYGLRKGRGDQVVDRAVATLAAVDQAVMERPQVREWFGAVFAEALIQGGKGSAYETALYWHDWGFDVADTRQPTLLWYGGRDTNVPASVGRWLAAEVPHSKFTEWPEHGHFTWAFSKDCLDVLAQTALGTSELR